MKRGEKSISRLFTVSRQIEEQPRNSKKEREKAEKG